MAMGEAGKVAQLLRGRVKWFDPEKGFGFIVAGDGASDILLHANVLRNFGQSSIADGSAIEVFVQETPRGLQAIQVLRVDPPEPAASPVLEDLTATPYEDMLAQPLEPARVKWFDKGKGFGFANVFGRPEDVFIHIEILRHSGLSDLQAGEAVSLRVIDGRRGRMAVQVCSWEAALRERDAFAVAGPPDPLAEGFPRDPTPGRPQAGNREAGRPEAGNREAGRSKTGSPKTGSPEAGNRETDNPETDNPETDNPETGNPKTGSLDAGNTKTGNPEAGNPKTGNPEAGNPEPGHADAGTAQARHPGSVDPETDQDRPAGPGLLPNPALRSAGL